MVEVFKTTVSDAYYAQVLLHKIHRRFPYYRANFDLTDCDRILRIQTNGQVDVPAIAHIVRAYGYCAEVLADEVIKKTASTYR